MNTSTVPRYRTYCTVPSFFEGSMNITMVAGTYGSNVDPAEIPDPELIVRIRIQHA